MLFLNKPINLSIFISSLLFTSMLIAQDSDSIEIYQGVVIDKFNNVFITNPHSELESINLKTGTNNWKNPNITLPIVVKNEQLIGLNKNPIKGRLNLSKLNASTGDLLKEKSLPIQNNVNVTPQITLSDQFDIKYNPIDASLVWKHQYQYAQGMFSVENKKKLTFGKVNLKTNNVLDIINSQEVTPIEAKIFWNKPVSIEGHYLNGVQGRQFKSSDHATFLVSKKQNNPSQWNKYSWTFYNTNKQKIGSIKSHFSYTPFVIRNDILLFMTPAFIKKVNTTEIESPLLVHAFDLATNKQLWKKPINDFKNPGILPH